MEQLQRRFRILALSAVASWLAVAALAVALFAGRSQSRFTEIDAERINIIGTNDRPVLALSNRRLIPGPSMNGKDYPPSVADGRDLLSGMIFFNEEGDEVGGLIFNGFPRDSGYSALGHLSFDQWKQNQVLALQYLDNGRSRRAGLRIWDRPTDVTMDEQLDLTMQAVNASGAEGARHRDGCRCITARSHTSQEESCRHPRSRALARATRQY